MAEATGNDGSKATYSIIVILRSILYSMGISKFEEFTSEDNQAARYAKALGHPARVAILRVLIGKRSCVCGDIVHELPLSQSTVSQHLKELKDSGLIQGEVDGKRVCYCIDPVQWAAAKASLFRLMDGYAPEGAECCDTHCC